MLKNSVKDCTAKEQPFLVSGTKVMDGNGLGLVCCVGIHSQLGIQRANMQTEPEITPLQIKLEALANTIGTIGAGGAALTFIGCLLGLVIRCIGGSVIY
jgi:magnesium-transporting ATPase (P-type)